MVRTRNKFVPLTVPEGVHAHDRASTAVFRIVAEAGDIAGAVVQLVSVLEVSLGRSPRATPALEIIWADADKAGGTNRVQMRKWPRSRKYFEMEMDGGVGNNTKVPRLAAYLDS